jgi:hypothetical protein
MTLFLVRAKIRIARYMRDKDEIANDLRIVRANSYDEAQIAYKKYWSDKDCDYDVSHTIQDLDIVEELVA